MKKKVLGLAAAALIASSVTAYANGITFSDIEYSFAKKDIQALSDRGIINGYDNGTFQPKNNITREEAAAIINRLIEQLDKQRAEDIAKLEAAIDAVDKEVVYVPTPTPAPSPVEVGDPTAFVVMEDLSFYAGVGGEGIDGWNVGFNIEHEKLPYNKIKSIKVQLTGDGGTVLATRTATGSQVAKLAADDETYGGTDGQLSAVFIARAASASNDYWNSSSYDLTAPTGATVTIVDTSGKIYKVSRTL